MRMHSPILLTALLALVACGHGSHEAGDEHRPASSQDAVAGSAAPAVLPALVLDDGAKWPLDEGTRRALAAMSATLDEADGKSAPGHQAAGRRLRAQLDDLIAGCTMSGAAHDQLHVWLAAIIPAIDGLASESDPAASRRRLQDVEDLLELANRHFA